MHSVAPLAHLVIALNLHWLAISHTNEQNLIVGKII